MMASTTLPVTTCVCASIKPGNMVLPSRSTTLTSEPATARTSPSVPTARILYRTSPRRLRLWTSFREPDCFPEKHRRAFRGHRGLLTFVPALFCFEPRGLPVLDKRRCRVNLCQSDNRSQPVLRFFEQLVDPYGDYPETDTPPTRLWPFMRAYSVPFRKVFIWAAILSVVVATIEIGLIWAMGWIVDILSGEPAQEMRLYTMMDCVADRVERVVDRMETIAQPITLLDKPDAKPLKLEKGAITIDGLSHHYGRGMGGLDNINLSIQPGEKVGLIGRSGAGKSTLVKLLLRFYDTENGRILIDGQDIADQDSALLHRSVRDNILYGRPNATEDQMIEAARQAEAQDFIRDLKDPQGRTGYDAFVGERGVKLSGGQRQRITLARVILKDAPILLLDEATSALDSEVEAAIQETLYGMMKGKTGRIVEQGPHDALLAQGGLYAGFWDRQSGGFLKTDDDEARAAARANVTGQIVDTVTNIKTVKLFAHTDHEDRAALGAMDKLRLRTLEYGHVSVTFRFCLMAVAGILPVMLVGGALWYWSLGLISAGDIAATGAVSLRLAQMTGWVSFTLMGLYSNIGEIEDGMRTLTPPHRLVDAENASNLLVDAGQIEFDKVAFRYGRTTGGVTDLSLTISPGEKLGIVGASGAGKSTLVALLMRLYDPESGRILIDDQDISGTSQDSLRRQIGMVTQETAMFNRSAMDNIRYGSPDATDDQVIDAAQKAEAHEFILGLKDHGGREGYYAHLGERGVKLSGGQRQRIALARAILKDAPILVLDEATSALDSEVEASIQTALERVMEGKTVLAIAHRLSTIAKMDRIIVMEEGRIVESGDHRALLDMGGVYARYWNRQSGGFIGIQDAAE
ncbi:putative ABC transporter ATP-binding protein [Nymphon striatum]|nr:putative ABC transporter ATP-binding protein [Nymphon striatum]